MQNCNATENPFFAVWYELAAAPIGSVIALPRLAEMADTNADEGQCMDIVIAAVAATPIWSNVSV